MRIDRRTVLQLGGVAAALPFLGGRALAQPSAITMWRDPGCGCCVDWAKRMEAAFQVKVNVVNSLNMTAVKAARGVPEDLRSCHTAMVQGLVVEGHVPPEDIKRLLAKRQPGVSGLAVPGMPAGSPGMDVGHNYKQIYKVFAFGPGGKRAIFAAHG
jgi:hypothetical protein